MVWRHFSTMATLATPIGMPVERIEGRLHGSDAPAVMLFAGAPVTAEFVAGALMTMERRTAVGRLRSPLALRGAAFERQCADADLAVAEVPWLWRSCLPARMPLRIPAWVSQEIRGVAGTTIVLPTLLCREVNRLCRREAYEVEFTTDFGAIRRFYADLYRPYVSSRFGTAAVVVDERRFLSVGRGMTLAMLRAGDPWIAGMLFAQRGGTLNLGWFGSSTASARAGASEVLDARVIERAVARGVRRVVMGHSRPSLADGVVRYKARFGAIVTPTRFPQRVIALRVSQPLPVLAAALNAAKFVSFSRGAPEIYSA